MKTKERIESIVQELFVSQYPEHRIKATDMSEKKDGKLFKKWTVSITVYKDKYDSMFVNGQIVKTMAEHGFDLIGVSYRMEYSPISGEKPVLNALFSVPFFLFSKTRVRA